MQTSFRRRTTLVAIFETHRALIDVFDRALASGLEDVLDIGSAALITRDEQGEVVTINNSVTRREGVLSGAMLGVAIGGLTVLLRAAPDPAEAAGALTLMAGVLLGGVIGALIGRMVAGMARFGFDAAAQPCGAPVAAGAGCAAAPGEPVARAGFAPRAWDARRLLLDLWRRLAWRGLIAVAGLGSYVLCFTVIDRHGLLRNASRFGGTWPGAWGLLCR